MNSLQIKLDDEILEVEIQDLSGAAVQATVNGVPVQVRIPASDPTVPPEWLVIADRPYEVALDREFKSLHWQEQIHQVQVHDLDVAAEHTFAADGRVRAPIPGVISRVFVEPGQQVEMGQTLLILEAMKMENQVRAPRRGVVTTLHATLGRPVVLGELLAEIA